jgi:hypothetical protein
VKHGFPYAAFHDDDEWYAGLYSDLFTEFHHDRLINLKVLIEAHAAN